MKRDALWQSGEQVQRLEPACELEGPGELVVQESETRKRRSSPLPRSSASTETHPSAVCACAMSPGPNTTLGIPPPPSTDASQKYRTPTGLRWPTPSRKRGPSGTLAL